MLQHGRVLKTLLHEVTQTQKDKYPTIPFKWGTQKRQIHGQVEEGFPGTGEGKWRVSVSKHKFLLGVMRSLRWCQLNNTVDVLKW